MRDKVSPSGLVFAVLLVLSAASSAAQDLALPGPVSPEVVVGSAFTYQGQLTETGTPVNATCQMTLTLYDALAAGNVVGSAINTSAAVADGLFTVPLDFGGAVFTGDARWLEIAVKCPGDANPITLAPRQALTATPYALSLRPKAIVTGTADDGAVLHVTNNSTTVYTSGVEGQSTSTQAGIGLFGWGSATTGTAYGVWGSTASTAGAGVYGATTNNGGTAYGVWGSAASTAGTGVFGEATAATGSSYGVHGKSSSNQGIGVAGETTTSTGVNYGVYGQSHSTSGFGVFGNAPNESGTNYGVYGTSASTGGRGVAGLANSDSGTTYGVEGQAYSTSGAGVYGHADATGGTTYGVVGTSASTGGRGVAGHATTTSGSTYGVEGQADSTSGAGVYGHADATGGTTYGVYGTSASTGGRGVAGHATSTTGVNYGVLGRTSSTTSGYGVYSMGNFGASGSKAAIVQTQGYGWRHLYSMESPGVLFEDVGTAKLAGGRAVVAIDAIFAQTVNLEEPYQVFVTAGGDGPVLLWVTAKTAASFTVRGVTLDGQAASGSFDYRIIAKRLGYEDVRLNPAAEPPAMSDAAAPFAPSR